MATPTYIWTDHAGRKVPLAIMDDTHLKNAYRRCVEVTYGNGHMHIKEEQSDTPITLTKAKLWVPRFIEEAERRKLSLPVVDKQLYYQSLRKRRDKKSQQIQNNINFDKKFKE